MEDGLEGYFDFLSPVENMIYSAIASDNCKEKCILKLKYEYSLPEFMKLYLHVRALDLKLAAAQIDRERTREKDR